MEIQVDSSVIKGSLESKHVIYTVATWTRLNVHEALNCTSDYVQFKMSNPSDGLSTGRECTRKKPSTVPFRNNLFLQLSYSYLDTLSFTCSENLQNVPAKRLAGGWSGCFFLLSSRVSERLYISFQFLRQPVTKVALTHFSLVLHFI